MSLPSLPLLAGRGQPILFQLAGRGSGQLIDVLVVSTTNRRAASSPNRPVTAASRKRKPCEDLSGNGVNPFTEIPCERQRLAGS